MMTVIIIFHGIVCILLIILVLIQRGRGGGLVESFAGVESMFGTKTNAFLTKATTVLSSVFFVTCLALAIMSVRQSRSLLTNVKPVHTVTQQAPNQQGEAAAIPAATSAQAQEKPKTE